ncbi:MAG: TIGR03016 family PEP-CTERM system-associated outer membrane protein [Rhodospirillales bacterium]|nr:TIGR03016 family PEP-CTERM system-associated outer membrane protein [Rhodospirillales bacterium]MDE2198457.1 TIGR03016 family PEP-CTERM system-associated outer membrane protein [Rhodospirillales bacterium]MDE2576736.1 TIGR03016 family PEP-CTERM system-associated outer membrane protein [Rhodospirillales bacterium]
MVLRGVGLLTAGLGLSLGWGWTAEAQGLLPVTGPDIRVGDLRSQFDQVFPGALPPASAHSWTFTPSLDVSETYDDGVVLNNGRTGTDFITRVSPGIAVSGDSERLKGSLFYAPGFDLFAIHGNQNRIEQNLNADVTATIVPDLLFLDLRGYAAMQSLRGGQTQATNGQGQVQTESFSASPRLQHRFGGTGTLVIGGTITRSLSDSGKSTVPVSPFVAPNAGGDYTSYQENASFTTGEDFGRLQSSSSAIAIQYAGTGALAHAHRLVFDEQLTYALNRTVALTAGIGHEDIVYGGSTPQNIHGLTWNGGVRLTPNDKTSLAVSYGRHDGATSLTVDGSLAPTARTRLFVAYSEAIGTQQEALQNALASSTVGPGGIVIDRVTGAPLQLNNNYFGTQSSLYRTTRASITGVLLYARDTFTASFEHDDNTLISASSAGAPGNTTGLVGSVAWAHILSAAVNTNASVQYAARSAEGAGNQNTVSFTFAVNYLLNATTTLSALATRSDTSGNLAGQKSGHDIVVVALHKSF